MPRHGENIRKRKDGRWEGRYYIDEPHSNRRIARSVYAGTYPEVKEKLLVVKSSAKRAGGGARENGDMAFSEVALEWLAAVREDKKYATYMKYRSVYEKHMEEELRVHTLFALDSEMLAEIFQRCESRAHSESMKRSIACVFNQLLSYAEIHYHTLHFRCAFQGRGKGRADRPTAVLNQTEQAKLLQYLYSEMDIYKLGILLCISTGLRLGEICSLKWVDIDMCGKVLHVNTTVQRIAVEGRKSRTALLEGTPKSIFSRREIPLSENLASLLADYYDHKATYVLDADKPMEPRTYQNKFQNYLKRAGIEKKNFHALRHTFATNCINSGTDVKSLSELLGHSDVKITLNRYVHPTMDTKRQHMNALSFVYGQIMGQE